MRRAAAGSTMHKGTLLASVTCALVMIGFAIWMVMDPLIVGTYTVAMTNPQTGERVTCHASFAPYNRAFQAANVCEARCAAFGFRREDGHPITMILDMSLTDIEQRWGKFIPISCKPRELQKLLLAEALRHRPVDTPAQAIVLAGIACGKATGWHFDCCSRARLEGDHWTVRWGDERYPLMSIQVPLRGSPDPATCKVVRRNP